MTPRPEYPRPRLRRDSWVNLNGTWEFGAGETARFDRSIVVPFCPQSRLSGIGEHPGDVVWYRRRFQALPAERQVLHFGAIDYRATIWVNDVGVARHEGGHTSFSVDISSAVHEGENVIVVRAEDPMTDKTIPRGKQYWKETPETIFYTPTTGIWQTVWLESLPERHVRGLDLTVDLDAGAVDFDVAADGNLEMLATLDGEIAGRWSGPAGLGRLQLNTVAAWHPESPSLYDLKVRLFDRAGQQTDQVTSYFGLRKVEMDHGNFLLNGEPYVQRLVLDQGYFPGGLLTAASDADLRRDIELAKACGFNGARKHQKIEDPRWFYWADVLGFLVWYEMPSFHEHTPAAEARLSAEWQEAVLRDRGHPSIVAWAPANESFGLQQVDPAVRARFLVELYHLTHGLDATRPVISNDGWEHALTDLCTLHDYAASSDLHRRYRSLQTTLDPSGRPHPPYLPGYGYRGEPILVSEFGGIKLGTDGWGYLDVANQDEFLTTYRGLIAALMERGPIEGFCYTQLTDVEQECNGLLTADRAVKLDPTLLRPITQIPKQR